MKLACLSAGRLLEQRRSGLTVAQGLKLEEHLASCASCRADANLLDELVTLTAETPATLSETARQRAIAGAFAASPATHTSHTRQRPARNPLLLAAAAASLLCVWFVSRELRVAAPAPSANTAIARAPENREPSHLPEQLEAVRSGGDHRAIGNGPGDRVLSGRIEVSGTPLAAGTPIDDRTHLRTADGALIALAHARLELRAGSEISWDAQARRLSLSEGSALIEVDPTRQQSFEVETKAFTVTVLGTRFEVTQSSVDVLRGRVTVLPKAGRHDATPLLLAEGSSQTHFELPPSAAVQPVPRDRPVAQGRAVRTQPDSDASAWLAKARAQLAARQLKQARSTLQRAKPLLRDDAARAQALSLEAECELQAHDFNSARDTYLRVAQRFAGLPAAETALFAAARIEAEHGQPPRAAALLTSYLSKHPRGSFAHEAALRLEQLQRGATTVPAR